MEKRTLLKDILFSLEEDEIGGWKKEFLKNREKIERILDRIDKKSNVYYPFPENVFRCFKLTKLEDVKIVIWGQDPYPTLLDDGSPRAQGYSFGVDRTDVVPKSLQNIYQEIGKEYDCFKAPTHGDLRWLSNQGILFMNSALTYNPENPKSHQHIWGGFTHIVIDILNEQIENCIHVLWGKSSEKLVSSIKSREILISSHPSPLSAYRGFFGCNHFRQINIILDRRGDEQINWNEDKNLAPTYVSKKKKPSPKNEKD